MYKPGDTVYVRVTGGIKEAVIISCQADYYHVKIKEKNCAFGIPAHRIVTKEEYLMQKHEEMERRIYPPKLH